MVSTYTTNKNIEKPAFNSYVDTWDVPVNADWDVIDEALGGNIALSVTGQSGNVALSVSDYQKAIISFSGVLTGNVTYVIPTGVGGVWVAVNTTTGAFALKVSSADGGLEVTLSAGQEIFFCVTPTGVRKASSASFVLGTTTISLGSTVTTVNGLTVTNMTITSLATPLSAPNGGTGVVSPTAKGVLIANGASAMTTVAPGTSGNTLQSNGTDWVSSAGAGPGASFPVGTVVPYAGTTAPAGWLLCYGQNVSRATYSALFTVAGTTFGAGDGSTTFGVPDLRGRAPFGKDNMGGVSAGRLTTAGSGINGLILGSVGGAQSKTLLEAEMPAHTHNLSENVAVNDGSTNGGIDAGSGYASILLGTSSAGSGQAFGAMNPALVLNQIIFASA